MPFGRATPNPNSANHWDINVTHEADSTRTMFFKNAPSTAEMNNSAEYAYYRASFFGIDEVNYPTDLVTKGFDFSHTGGLKDAHYKVYGSSDNTTVAWTEKSQTSKWSNSCALDSCSIFTEWDNSDKWDDHPTLTTDYPYRIEIPFWIYIAQDFNNATEDTDLNNKLNAKFGNKFLVDNVTSATTSENKTHVKIVPKDSITCLEIPVPVDYTYYNTQTNTYHFLHSLSGETSVADSTSVQITFGGDPAAAKDGYGHTGAAADFIKLASFSDLVATNLTINNQTDIDDNSNCDINNGSCMIDVSINPADLTYTKSYFEFKFSNQIGCKSPLIRYEFNPRPKTLANTDSCLSTDSRGLSNGDTSNTAGFSNCNRTIDSLDTIDTSIPGYTKTITIRPKAFADDTAYKTFMNGQTGDLLQTDTNDGNLYEYIAFEGAVANEVHLVFDAATMSTLQATPIDTSGDAACEDLLLANGDSGTDSIFETCRIFGSSCDANGVCSFDLKFFGYNDFANHDGRIKIDFRVDTTDDNDKTNAATSKLVTKRDSIDELFGADFLTDYPNDVTSSIEPFSAVVGSDTNPRAGRLEIYAKATPVPTSPTITKDKNAPFNITIGPDGNGYTADYVYNDQTILADHPSITRTVTTGAITNGSITSVSYPNGPGSINLTITPTNGANQVTIPYTVNIWGVTASATITVNLDAQVEVTTNEATGLSSDTIQNASVVTLEAADLNIVGGTNLNSLEFRDVNPSGARITNASCTNSPPSCTFTYNYQANDYDQDVFEYRILYTTEGGTSGVSDWYSGDATLNNTAPVAFDLPKQSAYQGTSIVVALTQHPYNSGNQPSSGNGHAYWDKQMEVADIVTFGTLPAQITLSPAPVSNELACGSTICIFSVTNDFGTYPTGDIPFTITAGGQNSAQKVIPIEFNDIFTVDPWQVSTTYDRDFTVSIAKGTGTSNGTYATSTNDDATEIRITSITGGTLKDDASTETNTCTLSAPTTGNPCVFPCTAGTCNFDIAPTAGNKNNVTFDYYLRYSSPISDSAETTGTATLTSNDAVINTTARVVDCSLRTGCTADFFKDTDYTDADTLDVADMAKTWANMSSIGTSGTPTISCDANGDCTVTADFEANEYDEMTVKFNYQIESPKGTIETPAAAGETVYLTFNYAGSLASDFQQTISSIKLNRQCSAVIKGSIDTDDCGGTCQAPVGQIFKDDFTTNIATGTNTLYDYLDQGTAKKHVNFGAEITANSSSWVLIGDSDGYDNKGQFRFSWELSDGTNTRKMSKMLWVEKQINSGTDWGAFEPLEVPTWYQSDTHLSVYADGIQSPYDACDNGNCTGQYGSISVAPTHICYVTKAKTVACWGRFASGQLGQGGSRNDSLHTQTPAEVQTSSGILTDVKMVSVVQPDYSDGYGHGIWGASCAVKNNGEVWCWGDMYDGSGGLNTRAEVYVARRSQYENTSGSKSNFSAKTIDLGDTLTCALSDTQADGGSNTGAIWCTGRHIASPSNGKGTWQNEGRRDDFRQMLLNGGAFSTDFISVSVGARHLCGLRRENVGGIWKNRVYCAGSNLGTFNRDTIGTQANIVSTDSVNSISHLTVIHQSELDLLDVRKVVAGYAGNCVIAGSGDKDNGEGAVYCWGWQDHGELGQSSDESSYSSPVHVANTGSINGNTVKVVDMSMDAEITCMLSDDRKIYCIGEQTSADETEGILGREGSSDGLISTDLVPVDEIDFVNVSVSRGLACGINRDVLDCWGDTTSGINNYGLGRGVNQAIHYKPRMANTISYGNANSAPTYRQCTQHLIINPTYP